MASTLADMMGSSCSGADRPCRNALRLDAILPATVLGPVLRLALARFAAICFSLAISQRCSVVRDQLLLIRTGVLCIILSYSTAFILFTEHPQRSLAVIFHSIEGRDRATAELHRLRADLLLRNSVLRQERLH